MSGQRAQRARYPDTDWLRALGDHQEHTRLHEIDDRAWLAQWDEAEHPRDVVLARLEQAAEERDRRVAA